MILIISDFKFEGKIFLSAKIWNQKRKFCKRSRYKWTSQILKRTTG